MRWNAIESVESCKLGLRRCSFSPSPALICDLATNLLQGLVLFRHQLSRGQFCGQIGEGRLEEGWKELGNSNIIIDYMQ